MSDFWTVKPQYLLPKQSLTQLMGRLARAEAGTSTARAIAWFVRRYQVNMDEAAEPDITQYKTFNEFFTRPLKVGARPIASAPWICPVDGAISQIGPISGDQIFQAKGHRYSTTALLGGDANLARQFANGHFATIYLSPKDYHRIHMPCDGTLERMMYVPGDLFSVNPATARGIPGLFARNERVVCIFQTPHGSMALVLVGATIVGSMATVWHGIVNPPRRRHVETWTYGADAPVHLKQGDEMGRFLLGSTVVLLWPQQDLSFHPDWSSGRGVRLGEVMATQTPSPAFRSATASRPR